MRKANQTDFKYVIAVFVILKILIHVLTSTNYELHRDAFLYIAQGDHLAWGYLSVPPLTAFLSKALQLVTGDSTWAVRLFPAIIGGLSVVFINLIVRELGGRKWAMIFASLAFLFSPAFLRSNMLFQPVSLNQFFWITGFYLLIRLINTQDPRFWIYLSVSFALGFLTKYSIVFLMAGFLIGMTLTPHRRLMLNKYFIWAVLIGFIIISPNIYWQYQNSWPVIYHMDMLRQYHLVHVELSGFLLAQLLMNLPVTGFWLLGLIYFLFNKELKKYRILSITYLAVIIILMITRGKSYYTIGLYSTLFAMGGIIFEKLLNKKLIIYSNLIFMILISAIMVPFSLPVLSHDRMLDFCQNSIDSGMDMPMRWEDGQVHSLPQDYADMIGWKELGENVIRVYESLPVEDQKFSYIYAENYGQAGAIRYYGLKKGLPEPISFHGSFIFWSPEEIDNIKYLIYVNDEIEGIQDYFEEIERFDGITNPYSRETGLPVYLCKYPDVEFTTLYKNRKGEELDRFMKNP